MSWSKKLVDGPIEAAEKRNRPRFPLIGLLALLLASLSAGCMTSQNGLCAPDEHDTTFEPILLGDWESTTEKGGFFRVERPRPDSNAYRITAIKEGTGKPEAPFVVEGHLIKLGDRLFADFVPLTREPGAKEVDDRHFIMRVASLTPQLMMQPLSDDYIKSHPKELPHVTEKLRFGFDGVTTVTATTRELRDFVLRHAGDEAVWEETMGGLRRRTR